MKKLFFISIIAILTKQILWTAFIPIWQFPDEQAHFAQVQNIVEPEKLNANSRATTSQEIYESEVLLETVRDASGNNGFTHRPQFNIPYTQTTHGIHENTINNFPQSFRQNLVINEATGYPPLYYVLSANFYQLAYSQNLITRVFVTRFLNILIFLGLTFITYKTAKLLFPTQKLTQFTFLLLVTFHPMLSFVSAGINSDNIYNLFFATCLYLLLHLSTYGLKLKTILLAILAIYITKYTKPQAQLLIPIAIYPFIISLLKRKFLFFTTLIVSLVIGFIIISKIPTQVQIFPDIPAFDNMPGLSVQGFTQHLMWTAKHTYREVIPWYWGVFRWLSLTYPRPIHRFVNWLTVFAILGLAIKLFQLIKKRQKLPLIQIGLLIFSNLIYFIALVFFDYLFMHSHNFSFGFQGRYYFPLITTHMALLLIGLQTLFQFTKYQKNLTKFLGLGMILWHTYAFYLVTTSYFGKNSNNFFIYASQYKPAFFKSPFLEIYLVAFVICNILLVWYYLGYEKKASTN